MPQFDGECNHNRGRQESYGERLLSEELLLVVVVVVVVAAVVFVLLDRGHVPPRPGVSGQVSLDGRLEGRVAVEALCCYSAMS